MNIDEMDPDNIRDHYVTAEVFPHVVLDGCFKATELRHTIEEFPAPDDPRWHSFFGPQEMGKQQLDNVGVIAESFPHCASILRFLASELFLDVLEHITGIDQLIPDLLGGGLHQTLYGGFLGMHTDSTVAFAAAFYRRVNVLLFLNDGWISSDGGALVFDTGEGTECVAIGPLLNRLVIFETTTRTFHGHPAPWRGAQPRRSLACYYYTEAKPASFTGHKETFFRDA